MCFIQENKAENVLMMLELFLAFKIHFLITNIFKT